MEEITSSIGIVEVGEHQALPALSDKEQRQGLKAKDKDTGLFI